jgi:nitrogen fixation protein NifU and related proteins
MTEPLYRDALVALARAAHERGRLQHPDCSTRVDNPLCGDEVTIDLKLAQGRITQVGHKVRGCLLCEASASWIGQHAVGCDEHLAATVLDEMRILMEQGELDAATWPDTDLFAPVHRVKSRRRCVLLPLEALRQALAQASVG